MKSPQEHLHLLKVLSQEANQLLEQAEQARYPDAAWMQSWQSWLEHLQLLPAPESWRQADGIQIVLPQLLQAVQALAQSRQRLGDQLQRWHQALECERDRHATGRLALRAYAQSGATPARYHDRSG